MSEAFAERFVMPERPAPPSRPFPRDPHEHFVEQPWVSRRLFETRDLGPVIVDPCAGFGNIVLSARQAGLRAYGSDLVKRAPHIAGGWDFFDPGWRAPRRAGSDFAIVSNPPFGGRKPVLRAFAQAALARARHVAMMIPVRRLAATFDWTETMPHVETVHMRERTSLWPGPIHAAKLAAGETLKGGPEDVCWLLFDRRRPRGQRPVVSCLRREA